ncbi:hypothetical protein KC220_24195, partial [Mycobacterium tuberculosis]|nr:hypothetical protein [Mycobacterium tuberculosis]
MKCFKCLGYGHIASNCPTKRNMNLTLSTRVVRACSFNQSCWGPS